MSTASRTAPVASALGQFSMRHILLAVAVCAAAFSVWRLPKGDWIDIPCTILGVYFALSMTRRAIAVRRTLRLNDSIAPEHRSPAVIYAVGLAALSAILVLALAMRAMAVGGLILNNSEHAFTFSVDVGRLPRNLIVLCLLISLGLRPCQNVSTRLVPLRQRIYLAIAICAALLFGLRFGMDQMVVAHLVQLAVSGIEMAERPSLLSPEQNISTVKRMDHFMLAAAWHLRCFWRIC